ncbi:hypothetical protein GCM10009799_46810 [Nocardiopsis rhodophaea]|uniref:Sap, sulfolipid-1-addressing protein n=1 Tax=Nocardiopsis rhodophaea TaxID=280238 RepID=A0ABN2TL44_9ACTN
MNVPVDLVARVIPLALLDTVSVSTLAIPIWFLLTPRSLRIGNVLAYLLLVGSAYLVLGILLMGLLNRVRSPLEEALASPAGDTALAVAGAGFLLAGLWHGVRPQESSRRGRLTEWRNAAVGENATTRGLVTVALIAVLIEVATMFPYLAALDILTRSAAPWHTGIAVLALYCLVMIAPALLATLVLLVSRGLMRPVLARVDRWLRANARENTAWLLAIVGILLLSNSTLFTHVLDTLRN